MRSRAGRVGGAILCLGWIAVSLLPFGGSERSFQAVVAGETAASSSSRTSGCLICHREATRGGHPVGMRPRRTVVPGDWPLDNFGRLMCSTCHVACGRLRTSDATRGLRHNLRSERLGTDFCRECHAPRHEPEVSATGTRVPSTIFVSADATGTVSASPAAPSGRKNVHAGIFGVAHPLAKHAAEGSGVDAPSRLCLECHDGTVASAKDPALTTSSTGSVIDGDGRSSHPVGIVYPPPGDSGAEGSYVPAEHLDSRLLLPDGRVSCVTCHDVYSPGEALLVMRNDESRLCFACHDI